jgi:hypothetical protein
VRIRFVFESEASNQPGKESTNVSEAPSKTDRIRSVCSDGGRRPVRLCDPASTKVDPAPVVDRPGLANSASIRPWGEYLSEDAIDAAGIETDLDGNAASFYASDWVL